MILFSYPNGFLTTSGVAVDLFAAHNNIIIRGDRFDWFITGVSNNGSGFLRITVDTGIGGSLPTSPDIPYGSKVWMHNPADPNGPGIYANVTSNTTSTIDFDLPYTGASQVDGWVNLIQYFQGYYIQVRAEVWTGAAWKHLGYSRHHTSPSGVVLIDVSNWCQENLNMQDVNGVYYGTQSWVDVDLCKQFKFSLSEIWIGKTPTPDGEFICTAANAAVKPPHKIWNATTGVYDLQGAALAEYFTEPSGADKAYFLSSVRKLRYWYKLPFELGFFYSINLIGLTSLQRCVRSVNQTGTTISTAIDNILGTPGLPAGLHNRVHRMALPYTAIGNPSMPAGTYKFFVYLNLIQSATNRKITEEIEVRVESCFPKKPVMLRGFDASCGWRHFCFSASQARGLNVRSNGTYQKWIADITQQEAGDIETVSKESVPGLTLGADLLDDYDMQIIEILLKTSRLQILTNPYTCFDNVAGGYQGAQWETVTAENGSFNLGETRRSKNSIQFNISFASEILPKQ